MKQEIASTGRFMSRHPLMMVLGVLAGATATKGGHGMWVVGGTLSLFPVYFTAIATFVMTRALASLVSRIARSASPDD